MAEPQAAVVSAAVLQALAEWLASVGAAQVVLVAEQRAPEVWEAEARRLAAAGEPGRLAARAEAQGAAQPVQVQLVRAAAVRPVERRPRGCPIPKTKVGAAAGWRRRSQLRRGGLR